jgi:hypothetical protein
VAAIASRERVTEELAAATAKIKALENSVKELKAQLDDLITTKEDDETQMLEKFRDLLNEKKVKIRQQQRLLAVAKVDPEKLANIEGTDQGVQHRDAGSSRAGKRKVPVKLGDEEESDDDFEKMDIDKTNAGDDPSANTNLEFDSDMDGNQQLSTDNDQMETASDPDSDDVPPKVPKTRRSRAVSPPGRGSKSASSGSKQTSPPSRKTRGSTQRKAAPPSDSEPEADDNLPPPPRQLPFMKNKKVAPPPKPTDNDETPSDDDSEL